MKSKRAISVLLSISFIFTALTSCNFQKKNPATGTYMAGSIGSTSEILIVLQNEQQWDNPVGATIKKYFAEKAYGLPQDEPIFKLLHLKQDLFKEVFQKQRNIFIVNIDAKIKDPTIQIKRNVWAAPQLVFILNAPNIESFVKTFTDKKDFLIEKYMDSERNRILDVYRSSLNRDEIQKVNKKFDFALDIPAGYSIAKSGPGMMWLRHEASMYSQGIFIISIPYIDTLQFSRTKILSRIQTFQRRYIPGPTKGSYMSLDREYVIPKFTLVNDFPTKYAVEIRGLWRVENDFMGGPFISYTFLNHNNNQIVTLFGYVYQPNKKKRDLLLQIESIFYSIRFGPKTK